MTSTSRSTRPRRPTQIDGWPRPCIAVSETTHRSARSRSAWLSISCSKWRRADLLITLDDEPQVEGEPAAGAQVGFHRLEVHPHLTLVVDRAAAAELVSDDHRLEGRRRPLVQGVGGLDVVVPVDQDGGQRRVLDALRVDRRVTRGLDQLCGREAGVAGSPSEVFGAAADVAVMGRVGRDRRDPAELDQLIDEAVLVGGAVGIEVGGAHPRRVTR